MSETGKNIPTDKEIKKEIAQLKELKPDVRRFNVFNDDNHAKIDAQIRVLEEDLSEDDIYDEWPAEDGQDEVLRNSSLDARKWLDGESEDGAPSEGWAILAKKK